MRKILYGLAAFVAVACGIAVFTGTSSAAPAGAAVQSQVVKVDGVTDVNGVITVKLDGTLANRPGDVVSFVTVTGPTGGAKNLPADVRVNGYVIDDNRTPADATDDTVGAVQLRVFGHQMVLDADGNYHLAVYRSLPFQADLKVTSGGIAYCAVNACS